ncbi:MAG: NfeD family protein [Candidatus Methanomethylophilaceae archaeon]|nr:NfeD family protein [Candidatus Methanomethylophilaceae archaeon]
MVVGAILLIVEAFTPGAFMVIPGTVLVIVGIIGAIYPSMMESWWSPVIAVAIAVPIAIVTTKVYQRLAVPEPPVTTVADSLVGRKGIVVVSTESGNMKGKVKVGSEVWSATSDEPLEAGVEVIIERSEGVHVHVRELTED